MDTAKQLGEFMLYTTTLFNLLFIWLLCRRLDRVKSELKAVKEKSYGNVDLDTQ